MSYRQLFSSVDCESIIIIEDDFKQGEYKKERVLYDIVRMALSDRESYIQEIKSISAESADLLSSFLALFDQCIDQLGRWEEVILDGILDVHFLFWKISMINLKLG